MSQNTNTYSIMLSKSNTVRFAQLGGRRYAQWCTVIAIDFVRKITRDGLELACGTGTSCAKGVFIGMGEWWIEKRGAEGLFNRCVYATGAKHKRTLHTLHLNTHPRSHSHSHSHSHTQTFESVQQRNENGYGAGLIVKGFLLAARNRRVRVCVCVCVTVCDCVWLGGVATSFRRVLSAEKGQFSAFVVCVFFKETAGWRFPGFGGGCAHTQHVYCVIGVSKWGYGGLWMRPLCVWPMIASRRRDNKCGQSGDNVTEGPPPPHTCTVACLSLYYRSMSLGGTQANHDGGGVMVVCLLHKRERICDGAITCCETGYGTYRHVLTARVVTHKCVRAFVCARFWGVRCHAELPPSLFSFSLIFRWSCHCIVMF